MNGSNRHTVRILDTLGGSGNANPRKTSHDVNRCASSRGAVCVAINAVSATTAVSASAPATLRAPRPRPRDKISERTSPSHTRISRVAAAALARPYAVPPRSDQPVSNGTSTAP